MQIAVLDVDLGKNSCSVAGLENTGRVVLRRRMRRDGVAKLAAGLPACVVAMEACCGAHHLGRVLRGQGHTVLLMSPEYVRPYVKAQKNDDRDAEAIAEAATRPTMRFVELKSEGQLDLQMLHRARDRLQAHQGKAGRSLLRWLRDLWRPRRPQVKEAEVVALPAEAAASAEQEADLRSSRAARLQIQAGTSGSHPFRLPPLTCLAPHMVEGTFDGRQPKGRASQYVVAKRQVRDLGAGGRNDVSGLPFTGVRRLRRWPAMRGFYGKHRNERFAATLRLALVLLLIVAPGMAQAGVESGLQAQGWR